VTSPGPQEDATRLFRHSLTWINEPTKVFIARRGVHELTTTILTAEEVRDLIERMLKSSGRRVDLSTPFVEPNRRLGQVPPARPM